MRGSVFTSSMVSGFQREERRCGVQTHAAPEQPSLPLVQTSCPLLRPPHFLLLSSTAAVTAAVRAGQGEKRDTKVSPFQGSYRKDSWKPELRWKEGVYLLQLPG